jgi:hypothetical protein
MFATARMIKLFYFLVFLCSAGDASLLRAVPTTAQPSKVATEERVWYLLPNGTMQHDKAFLKLYQHFNDTFDFKLYGHFLDQLKQGVNARNQRDAYSSFTYYAKGPHCDKGQRPQVEVSSDCSVSILEKLFLMSPKRRKGLQALQ